MNLFATILLIIIVVLLIGDLIFLYKILNNLKTKKKRNADEKYFELKYNINLLKSISAILIFVFGFIGYSSFVDFKTNMKEDIDKTLENQKVDISEIDKTLSDYKKNLDSLIVFKNQLKNLLEVNDLDLKKINKKVSSINNSFKYNPKIYIVNDLNFPDNAGKLTFSFSNMTTVHGEKLPKFNKAPFITVQGYSAGIQIIEVTKNYVILDMNMTYMALDGNTIDNYKFDLWIGSQE
ncbi:hypothetical protein [Maribacter aquivivus]|uniref:hypothetical protein n=1 Tax=Maribacter aquivivus TaxID=228958 RepID=UPI002494ABD3|nr:hypothetical protein [Maribacter aquivivus]